jgi:2,3-bisphosphoglycerate-dependent phosphoglycerate mutase
VKKIYIVRHCKADGQSPDAPLTELGHKQAKSLCDFFLNIEGDKVISSPFLRACQSIEPLSNRINVQIDIDHRLSERILSDQVLPDWLDKLKETFHSMDLSFQGGESSREAMSRAVEVIEEILKSNVESTIVVTHGNLMALLLKHFDDQFGFETWASLTNPDVYLLMEKDNRYKIQRLWYEKKS